MTDTNYFWAVTGRMPFDDEDCPYATPEPCTRHKAEADFRQFMVDMALDDESEDDILDRIGLNPGTILADRVLVCSMFYSESMIFHGQHHRPGSCR